MRYATRIGCLIAGEARLLAVIQEENSNTVSLGEHACMHDRALIAVRTTGEIMKRVRPLHWHYVVSMISRIMSCSASIL